MPNRSILLTCIKRKGWTMNTTTQQESRKHLNRREFFSSLTVAWIAFGAAASGLLSLIFRYLYPNVNFEPDMELVIPKEFQLGEGVNETFKKSFGTWLVKSEGKVFALSTICTHLGCIPNWTPATQTFECPCHGSGYYVNGINFKGPAPRPLERFQITRTAQGDIKVDKTKTFRQEKGQWTNPKSYLNS